MLTCLYGRRLGRCLLKLLCWPPLSRLVGCFLDTHLSRRLIPGFIRRNHIALDDFIREDWPSFNAFFTRQIQPSKRPLDASPEAFISPCDGLLRAYPIREGLVLSVKDKPCTLPLLLQSRQLAKEYADGLCLVFRLTPSHYHRYCYPDSGVKTAQRVLPGVLHTVQPVATEVVPVYQLNSREYTLLRTRHFGPVIFMEVGAMFVGRICNYRQAGAFRKGEEKGRFEFGGSTILVLLKPQQISLRKDIVKASRQGIETPVILGERLNL